MVNFNTLSLYPKSETMKLIHYVLIAKTLTGDSEVKFFDKEFKAKEYFRERTEPLLAICREEGLEEDDVYYEGENRQSWRFNAGESEALDAELGECNTYIAWATVEVNDDVTHYFAEYSDWVDDSSITFYNETDARIFYESSVMDALDTAEYQDVYIDRADTKTWQVDGQPTYFTENETKTEAFFGFDSDMYWTVVLGELE